LPNTVTVAETTPTGSPALIDGTGGLNDLMIAGKLAGTFNYTSLFDLAGDPIWSTQTPPPNRYIATAPAAINITSCTFSAPSMTCVLASAPLLYQCYNGGMWTVAGNAGFINGTYVSDPSVGCNEGTSTIVLTCPTGKCGATSTGTVTYAGNGLYMVADGNHFTTAMNRELSTGYEVAVLAANNALNQCTIRQFQLPYYVLVAANQTTPSLTLTLPLQQLFPEVSGKWQVCSISADVTTAFAGTTTLTMNVGDSTGTSTTYLSGSMNLQATGVTFATNPTFQSNNGVVQMNFTSTGSNINALTAGNMYINLGIVVRQ
jgi:hypothetical protein